MIMMMTYARGSVLLWRCCDMLYHPGFMNDVVFAHNGQEYTTRKSVYSQLLNKGQ